MANISNSINNTVVNGTDYADTIKNSGDNVTINADAGDDFIGVSGTSGSVINGGYGKDRIYDENGDSNKYLTIHGGDGDDYITTVKDDNVKVFGDAGDDYICHYYYNHATLDGGDGNDEVRSLYKTEYNLLNGGNGDDTVYNGSGKYATLMGGSGNDTIINGATTSYNGGTSGSPDTLNVEGTVTASDHVTVDGGAGNDVIWNYQVNQYVSIYGGSGGDSIRNDAQNVTVSGGANDDTISLSDKNIIQYANGDGNDIVYGYNSTDTIQITDGTYSTQNSSNDVIIKVDNGSITLKDAKGQKLNIIGEQPNNITTGWATIKSSKESSVVANNATIASGGSSADTIQAIPIDHTIRAIYGNAGNDVVSVSGNYGILWSKSTVNSGTGNDSIYIKGDVDGIHPSTVSIDSGAGNDLVSIYGGYSGIHGGTIGMTSKSSVPINLGDGNDTLVIRGMNSHNGNYGNGIDISNVKINGGSGNDLVSISGSRYGIGGVSGYGNSTVSIDGGNGADTIAISSIDTLSNVTITAGAGDVISVGSGSAKYLFNSKNDVTINGAVFKATSANTSANLKTSSKSTTLRSSWNGTVKISNGTKITDTSGNVRSTSGTYSVVNGKFSNTIIPPTSNINYITNTKNNTIVSGTNTTTPRDYITNSGSTVTINAAAGNDTIKNTANNVKIYAGNGNDSIYIDVKATKSNVTVDGGSGNDKIYSIGNRVSLYGGAGDDSIYTRSSRSGVTINGGKGNDTLTGTGGTSSIYGTLFKYANGDGNDVITNIGTYDTITISGSTWSTTKSGSNMKVKIGSGSILLKNAARKKIKINPSTNDINYITNYNSHTLVSGTSNKDSIYNSGSYATINAGSGNDTVYNDLVAYVSISAGAGNDSIYNNSSEHITIDAGSGNDVIANSYMVSNISINGGAGNDSINAGNSSAEMTLNGGSGNDTLIGSNHSTYGDVFQFGNSDGYDVITNYETNDTVHLTGIYSASSIYQSVSSSNRIIRAGSTYVTLKGAATKNIKVRLADGSMTTLVAEKESDGKYIYNENNDTVISGTSYKDTIYNLGSRVKISGNSGDDIIQSISYSFSESSNVTINGNEGNDTITNFSSKSFIDGGSGNDSITSTALVNSQSTLLGGSGDDIIDFTEKDSSISGGDGNDTIKTNFTSNKNTINGGKGNDYINLEYNSATVFQYASGDGNDTIYGYNSTSTIQITSGSYSTQRSGSDMIVSVGNGKMILKNAGSTTLNITTSRNYEERWFMEDDNNFTTSDFSNILKKDNLISNDCNLNNELQLNQQFNQGNVITSLTYSESKKK